MRALVLALLLAGPALAQGVDRPVPRDPASVPVTTDLAEWLPGFRVRAEAAGITSATLDAVLPTIERLPDVIRRDRNQSEFSKAIWEYLDTAVSDLRVRNGRAALARQREALEAIEAEWGVEAEIVVAIWGLESSYGTFRGSVHIPSALATLAADSRRADFFEAQLIAALRILQDGETRPERMRGSWAGAMGHTQFMPTSYLEHAVDGTGDGRRDIWGDDPRDALASTAAYLAGFGWTTGQPWGVEVTLPEGFDYAQASSQVTKTPEEWTALGVRPVSGGTLPGEAPVSIRAPAGAQGVILATYPNFEVLERYNTADAYVIGVGHLADRIAGAGPFQAGWPRGDRALTFAERVEMQRLLATQGFDPQKFDGLVGPLTLAAIRGWQASTGRVPDGYMNPTLLDVLRAEAGAD